MELNLKTYRRLQLACPIMALMLTPLAPTPAHADFFDDMRQTFETDVPHFFQNDVPHFFQDDIPCAFGGQPTSGTKKSCKSADHPAKDAPEKHHDLAPAPSDKGE